MRPRRPSHAVHLPLLRAGEPYFSLDALPLPDLRTGEVVAEVSQANPGLIARDLSHSGRAPAALDEMPVRDLLAVCRRAAELFTHGELPLGESGQSPADYRRQLSATTGLPEALARRNMEKIRFVLAEMETVLAGLTRGLELEVLDRGLGVEEGRRVSFRREADRLGAVLPGNSPGVHSLWLPAIALKAGLALKPGRQEPWTPHRVLQALLAAGCPPAALGFYPTGYAGAAEILLRCRRSLLFGDRATVEPWRDDPRVEIHGPGWSKLLFGPDQAPGFRRHLDLLAESVADNGGRSCVNASGVWTPSHGREIALALAERLAAVEARPLDDPQARLAAFPSRQAAERLSAAIDALLAAGGAEDVTAPLRDAGRVVEVDGCAFLLPTVIFCTDPDHPLARAEYLFPYVAVVEVEEAELVASLGPSLVVTALTELPALRRELLAAPHVERLNLGPIATSRVAWDQPHEGNLFQHLYRRRALQTAAPPGADSPQPTAHSRADSPQPTAHSSGRLPAAQQAGGGPVDGRRSTVDRVGGGGPRRTFGAGCLARLGEVARELGGSRVLVVTDAGLKAAGHPDRALAALEEAGLEAFLFDGVAANPSEAEVEAGTAVARERGVDLLVGLGGGSAMDCAKGINFLLTNGGRMEDYWGSGKAQRPMLPSVGVPTTAGTGSEAQSFALISRSGDHRKMACGDPKARFRAVLLDPELTASTPRRVAAAAGIDAVAHAVESHVTRRRNPISARYAREAWRLLAGSLAASLHSPQNEAARGRMLLGAHLAGAAIEGSMLGAAHATANPLTAVYGTTHGVAVGLMLPSVVRFNGPAVGELYRELLALSGESAGDDPAESLARRLESLRRAAGLPGRLRELGIEEGVLPELARRAAQEWTGTFNPRPLEEPDFLRLYQAAW